MAFNAESHQSGRPDGRQQPPNAGTRSAGGNSADPDQDTLYELLNVPITATRAEITTAYRQAMRRSHPDRVPPQRREAAEALAKTLNAAYATLSNPEKRRRYDETIRKQELQDQIMKRYVGGFAGPGAGARDFSGQSLKREMTSAEKRDRTRSERSAILTILSVFLVVCLGAIGLLILFALISWGVHQIF